MNCLNHDFNKINKIIKIILIKKKIMEILKIL